MERPYVICHILSAVDGKITGSFMKTDEAKNASAHYEQIFKEYKADAWMGGTTTTEQNITMYRKPDLDDLEISEFHGDYVAMNNQPMYYISLDPLGKIGWDSCMLRRRQRPKAHVVEIVTSRASEKYLAFLRKLNISYIVCGDEQLDCDLALRKLNRLFNIDRLLLTGGGFINGTFLFSNLIDELSLVIAPVADGETETITVFEKMDEFKSVKPKTFKPEKSEILDDGSIWLKYSV